MGWTFEHGASRADIIKRVTASEENEYGRWTSLAYCTKGNVLWHVFEWHRKDRGETRNVIGCTLLAPHKAVGWGYKSMDESAEPYYYSCPLAYLDMAPEASAEWRRLVRKWHVRMSRRVGIGDIWSLVGCKVRMVEITSVRPLRGRGKHDDVLYRLSRKYLGDKLLASDLDSEPQPLPTATAQATA